MGEIENESSIRRCKVSLKTVSNAVLSSEDSKLKSSFDELLSVFLKGTCPHDCFRPLPPMIGNGDYVDLLKLFSVVKEKGGFEAVSRSGLWGEVGLLYGACPTFGSAIKLIYLKYLASLEHWLVNMNSFEREWCSSGKCSEEASVELDGALGRFVRDTMDEMRKNSEDCVLKTEKRHMNFVDLTKGNDVEKKLNLKKIKMGFIEIVDLTEDNLNDGKLKRKNIETGFANNIVLTEENHDVKKLKRNETNMAVASDGDLIQVNNDKKLEKTKSEMSFADFVSPNLSFGAEVADNVITGSENSDACKACYTQVEDKSTTVDKVLLKEKVYTDGKVRYFLSNQDYTELKRPKSEMSFVYASNVGSSSLGPDVAGDRFISSENSDTSKKDSTGVVENLMNLGTSVKDEVSSYESKQEGLSNMLRWMAKISKDPTDPELGMIPESNCQKQVLLARETLFLKRNQVSGSEQLLWQKKHKMHPSMFDDQIKSAERSSPRLISSVTPSSYQGRFRQRLVARLDLQPTAAIYTSRPRQRIPVGRDFQAEIPEWSPQVSTESDSKWLGTLVWPPEKRPHNSPMEKDTNCECQYPGSIECVLFHISERRKKMKLELGPVFYAWKFDKMGEECSLPWSAEEERKFKAVIKENPNTSLYRCFGHQMCKIIPKKSWPDQVSYYFNVFMLRRRRAQNRLSLCDIDSDDDETEYRTPSNRSGLRT